MSLRFGLHSFGDVTAGADGALLPHDQVLRDLVDQGVLADQVGVDFFGLGEHHRDDFAVSAPEVVLAAVAARTSRIHVGSAVTVLSSDDPVRVFQRFSTLHALSGGRAEAIVGRGSFSESFPLFGLDRAEYETLFTEKLDLFARLLREPRVTWSGSVRSPLADQPVFPPLATPLPCWVGVGGSPESVVRAARADLPLMLAIIGGDPARFLPYADLYRRTQAKLGHTTLEIGVHSPGLVAATDAAAKDALWPGHKALYDRIGAERGWPAMRRDQFEAEVAGGSLYVGSPDTVAARIARTATTLGLARFDLKYSAGPTPHEMLMESIRLYGAEVIPRVRKLLG